jgi:integrase
MLGYTYEVPEARCSADLLLPSLSRRSEIEAQSRCITRERQVRGQTKKERGIRKGKAMIYKPKGRKYFKVKFHFQGRVIHKATRAKTKKDARTIEATLRSQLAKGDWGILEMKPSPKLGEFFKKDFLPFTRTRFVSKVKSRQYYEYGAARLLESDIADLKLDEVTGQHAAQFAARNANLSPSTVNCGLRTLRRALSLAVEWGKLDRMPRIPLAKGEHQRERVLTDAEVKLYLESCRQPWRDAATVILGTGMRPGEVFTLRWEFVLLNGQGGLIHVSDGKSKAARRILPMIPDVYHVLKSRHEQQCRPAEGWVFPSTAKCEHLEQGTAKTQHAAALAKANAEAIRNGLPLPLKRFEPYVMRHTALTRMSPFCDPFTLARIAGHSSITITQRYCHPQADALEAAFSKFGNRGEVVTEASHHEKQLPPASPQQAQVSIMASWG